MNKIKLGMIYKRKGPDDYSLEVARIYPKYMVLTGINKTMFDQKRYTFLDVEWDGTPKIVIPDYVLHDHYEMVEGEIDGQQADSNRKDIQKKTK